MCPLSRMSRSVEMVACVGVQDDLVGHVEHLHRIAKNKSGAHVLALSAFAPVYMATFITALMIT